MVTIHQTTKKYMEQAKDHLLKQMHWGVLNIVRYRGVLVSKHNKCYSVLGNKCKTEEDVDKAIDEALEKIGKTVIID